MQGKQAKVLSPVQERAIVAFLEMTRYPQRDRVLFLLSIKAGLRAKEIANLTWAMVTDAGGAVAGTIHLENRASKGKTGGRTIPMHPDLQAALVTLQTWRADMATPGTADHLLGAGRGVVACHRTLVVSSVVYLAADGGLFVTLRPPDIHYARRTQNLAGGRQSAGRARTRGAYQPRHDATVHRGGHRGQAEAGRAAMTRSGQATADREVTAAG